MKLFALVALAMGLDDSTMSLLARVDPIPSKPVSSSLIQASAVLSPEALNHDESTVPFSGIQMNRPRAPKRAVDPSSSVRVLDRKHIHTSKVHLHDAPVAGTRPPVSPDVLICSLPANHNALSVRACDLITRNNAVLSQVLRCTDRVHPETVADLLIGSQKVPIDLSVDAKQAVSDISTMDTPLSVQVTFGACTSPRDSLPDLDVHSDYLAFVLLNPDIELAAENFALGAAKKVEEAAAYKAGIVMVSVPMLFQKEGFKSELATNFINNVSQCNVDGVCTANELISWTPSGDQVLDWYVGTSAGTVRIVGGKRTRTTASFLQK